MQKDSVLLEKTISFGARIVKLHRYLLKEKKESVISKQIFRSGTSIGANAHEAAYAVSKPEFIAKMHISLKETAETEYWLKLLMLSGYLDNKQAASLLHDCLEIKRILIASINTAKSDELNIVFSLFLFLTKYVILRAREVFLCSTDYLKCSERCFSGILSCLWSC